MNEMLKSLEHGNYRHAAEEILEKMKSLADEHGNPKMANELDAILKKLHELPNIDWKKVEQHGVWEISNFVK